jgi:hypothetical protein
VNRTRDGILRLVLVSVIAWPAFCLAKDKDITIQVDTHLPEQNSVTVWLSYLLARANYRDDHKLPLPASGDIIPTFQEEVYARATAAQIYQELKDENKGSPPDPYWETLLEVKKRDFLGAYVRTYLRRPSWPKGDEPNNLAAFQSWARSRLKNHTPQTHGSIVPTRK